MTKIDIISGFLGAGKTTFANMLLHYYIELGLRPAYIVNEFGQTGLDAQIIESNGFMAVEIDGGCICCTLKDDIATAMAEVIDTFSPTNIAFEPSGIFIFDNFFEILRQPCLKAICEIGAVLTVVDSVNFTFSKTSYGSFIYNQIKNSPIIILSKLEKTNKNIDEIICDIKNINSTAFIASKTWNDWDKSDFDNLLNMCKQSHDEYNSHQHSKLKSFAITISNQFSQDKIAALALYCKNGVFGDICRVKGIVMIDDEHMLINIALNDMSISRISGIFEQTLTFIGNIINETNIINFIRQV